MTLNRHHPTQFSMEGLEYTIRSSPFSGNEMIITSPTDELRAYLEVHLPNIARTCDDGDEEDEERQHWARLERLTPARPAEKAEDSSPSP